MRLSILGDDEGIAPSSSLGAEEPEPAPAQINARMPMQRPSRKDADDLVHAEPRSILRNNNHNLN